MKSFRDNADRSWTVAINVDAIKRVRGLLNIDLLETIEGKLLDRLASDPVLLCDVLYCLCKPEADERQISDEDFGRGMAGDAIELAATALLEELVDFFPSGKRQVLTKALAKLRQFESRAIDVASRRLDGLNVDETVEQLLKMPGDLSGSSPALSVPVPVG